MGRHGRENSRPKRVRQSRKKRQPLDGVDSLRFFPVNIVFVDPKGLGADALGYCHADDGFDYIVKDDEQGRSIPHNEWFCTSLAEQVGIASAHCAVLRQLDGTYVFGSRYVGDAIREPLADYLSATTPDRAEISIILSRILAFDHFVHNGDRHLDNFILVRQRNGYAIIPIDYSRAWMYHDMLLSPLPFSPSSNTRNAVLELKRRIGDYIRPDVCDAILDALLGVDDSSIEYILQIHPNDWLRPNQRAAILEWWKSSSRVERVQRIKQGIRDGSYI